MLLRFTDVEQKQYAGLHLSPLDVYRKQQIEQRNE